MYGEVKGLSNFISADKINENKIFKTVKFRSPVNYNTRSQAHISSHSRS